MRASRDALFYCDKVAGHLHFKKTYKNRHRYERISRLQKLINSKFVNIFSV